MMIDYLLSDPFMAGIITTVLFLLVLVTIVPVFTRRQQYPQEWRIVEPPDQITTIEAKRIEVRNG